MPLRKVDNERRLEALENILALCAKMQTIGRVMSEFAEQIEDPRIKNGIDREVKLARRTAREVQGKTNEVISLLKDQGLI